MKNETTIAKASAPCFEALEPRVLYSAEIAFALLPQESGYIATLQTDLPAASWLSETHLQESSVLEYPYLSQDQDESETLAVSTVNVAESSSAQPTRELVIVDVTHPDLQDLLQSLRDQPDTHREITIVTLEGGRDALLSISEILQRYEDLDAVHLISHASDGRLLIGDDVIDLQVLQTNSTAIETWGSALTSEGDFLLYGCNLSASDSGQQFAQTLSVLTRADVASSADLTGHLSLDADWDLEVEHGEIDTEIVANQIVQDDWVGSLDISSGLIHRFEFENDVTDSVSTVTGSEVNSVGYVAGHQGTAIELNTNPLDPVAYAEVPAVDSPVFGTGDFSIALWVNSTTPVDAMVIGDSATGQPGYHLISYSDGSMTFAVFDGVQSVTVSHVPSIYDAQWHLIVLSRVSGQLEMTFNTPGVGSVGSSSAGPSPSINLTGGTPLTIGAAAGDLTGFNGLIDDVRVYNRALGIADISELSAYVNDEQVLANSGPLNMLTTPSTSVVLSNAQLQTTDPDTPAAGLVYTLTGVPSHSTIFVGGVSVTLGDTFTQMDIDNNNVSLTRNANATPTPDGFSFGVDDGQGYASSGVVDINYVNSVEESLDVNLPLNTLAQGGTATITSAFLSTSDGDTAAAQLVYTLDSVPGNGELFRSNVPLAAGDTFTQADIDNRVIIYHHDGSATLTDQFDFTVDDGSGTATSAVFDIQPTVNLAPVDLQLVRNSSGVEMNLGAGNAAYFEVANAERVLGGLTEMTIELQFQYESGSAVSPSLFSYDVPGTNDEIKLSIASSGIFKVHINGVNHEFVSAAASALTDGDVHSVAVTWDSSSGVITLFVDGVFQGTQNGITGHTIQAGGGTARMGFDNIPGGVFGGTYYDARIFDTVRTAAEIQLDAGDGLESNEPGLIAHWSFDSLSENRIVEHVNGLDLTAVNLLAAGFTPGTVELSGLNAAEAATVGTVVGQVYGIDPEREALVQRLLAEAPAASYYPEFGSFHLSSALSSTWGVAESNAASQSLNGVSGRLATIESASENAAVYDSMLASGASGTWLAGSDAAAEGDWRWLDNGVPGNQFADASGDSVDGLYSNFASTEPNGITTENYLEMRVSDGQWNDNNGVVFNTGVAEFDSNDVANGVASGGSEQRPLTYSLVTQTMAGAFAIDTNTGVITVANGSLLDFETTPVHTLTLRVADDAGNFVDKDFDVVLSNIDEPAVHNVPGGQITVENTPVVFSAGNGNGVQIDDEAGQVLTVSLDAANGTLTLSQTTGLSFNSGDGTADAVLEFTGTVEDINAALDGLSYLPANGFVGNDSLNMTTRDGSSGSNLDTDPALLGHYQFDTATVTDATVGPDAIAYGDASQTLDAERAGVLQLDGNGDGLQVPGQFGTPAAITLSTWVNIDAVNGSSEVISLGSSLLLRIDHTTSGDQVWGQVFTASGLNVAVHGEAMSQTGWRHVAYVVDPGAGIHRLYIDGVLVGDYSITESIDYSAGTYSTIGMLGTGVANELGGSMDDVRIYSRALSSAEIVALGASKLQPEDVSAVALTILPAVNDAPYFTQLPNVIGDPVPAVIDGASSVTSGDIDGDGDIDIVTTAGTTGDVSWFANDGAGNFTASTLVANELRPEAAVVYDLEGDGDLDIVVASYDSSGTTQGVLVYSNNGSGSFTRTELGGASAGAWRVDVGDLDGDGDGDIAAVFYSSDEIVWFENTGPGWQKHAVATADGPYSVSIADINGDGSPDLVTAIFRDHQILYHESDGNALPAFSTEIAALTTSPFVATTYDLDQDGDQDIVYAAWGLNNLSWLENTGGITPTFTERFIDTAPGIIYRLDIDDADGDGDPDILMSEQNSSNVSLYVNDGATQFTRENLDTGASSTPWSEFADVDGDGDLDVLVAEKSASQIVVHENLSNVGYIRVTVFEDSFVNIPGIGIGDDDAGSAQLEVSISSANGRVSLMSTSGLSFTVGNGSAATLHVFTGTLADINAAIDTLQFAPVAQYHGLARIDIDVDDLGNSGTGGNKLVSQALFVDVIPVNDAPTVAGAALPAVGEDSVNPPGDTVANLFAATVSDIDSGSTFDGIAVGINAASAGDGVWQYSTDGSTWHAVGAVSAVNALVLDPATYLRFLPAANFSGVPLHLALKAIDDSYTGTFTVGATRVTTNVMTSGGSSSFSSGWANLATSVTAANDAPTLGNSSLLAINEDAPAPTGDTIANLFAGQFSDVDAGDTFAGLAIAANPATFEGEWAYSTDGVTWHFLSTVSSASALVLQPTDSIAFLPAVNYEGTPPPLSVHALDSTYSGSYTSGSSKAFTSVVTSGGTTPVSDTAYVLTTAVLAVNDAPAMTNAALADVVEDSLNPPGAAISTLFSANVTDPDSGSIFSGVAVVANTATAEGSWQYSSDAGSSWHSVAAVSDTSALFLASSDWLRFLPSADFQGTPPVLSLHAVDDTWVGGFSNGASRLVADSSSRGGDQPISAAAADLTTSVSGVNDAPAIAAASLFGVAEDSVNPPGGTIDSLFTGTFTDPDAGDTLLAVAISGNTPGTEGVWQYSTDGTNWFDVQARTPANALVLGINDLVRFLPAADYVGTPPNLWLHGFDSEYQGAFTSGAAQVTFDVLAGSPTNSVSTSAVFLTTGVYNANNDAPVISAAILPAVPQDTANPPGATVAALFSGSFTDPDPADTLLGIAIVSNPPGPEGDWQYSNDGTVWYSINAHSGSNALVLSANDLLRFLPASGFTGSPGILGVGALDSNYTGGTTIGSTPTTLNIGSAGLNNVLSVQFFSLQTSVTDINDAPVANDDAYSVLEGGMLANTVSTNDTDVDGDVMSATVLTPPLFGTLVLAADGSFTYQHDGSENFTDSFVYQQSDSFGLSDTATVSITVTPQNDAPAIANAMLATVAEDTINPTGASVSSLFGSTYSDPDAGDSLLGIAVSSNTPGPEGDWQYSTDGGASWFNIQSRNDTNALVLGVSHLLRFLPAADYVGAVPNLEMHALDQAYTGSVSSGSTKYTLDLNIGWSNNAVSQSAASLQTSVFNVNDQPVVTDTNLAAINEDALPVGDSVLNLVGPVFTDADSGSSLAGIVITGIGSVASEGQWEYSGNGTSWDSVQLTGPSQSLALSASTLLRFVPLPDYNGSPGSLDFHALDDTYTGGFSSAGNLLEASVFPVLPDSSASALPAQLSTNVVAQPDVPVANNDMVGVLEGGLLAADVSLNDSDIDGDPISASIVTAPLYGLLTLNADGSFSYQHDGSENFSDSFVYLQTDTSGLTAAATVTIVISPDNDPPHDLVVSGQPLSVTEIDPVGSSVGFVVGQDVDDSVLTYAFAAGGDAGGRFVINASTGEITLNDDSLIDYAANTSHTVTVSVFDAALGPYNENFVITVHNVNDSPVIQSANLQAITEDTLNPAGMSISALYSAGFLDPDPGDTLSGVAISGNTAVADGQWQYTINGLDWIPVGPVSNTNALVLQVGDSVRFLPAADFAGLPAPLDLHALDSTYTGGFTTTAGSVSIDVSNAGANSAISATPAQLFTTVAAVNDPPVISLANTVSVLPENTDTSAPIDLADIVITDPDGGANMLSLAGPHASLMQISGSKLQLMPGVNLDYESLGLLSVNVIVNDPSLGTNTQDSAQLLLNITDSNEPPSISILSQLSALPENTDTSSSIKLADLNVSDDAPGLNAIILSGPDAANFVVIGSELHLAAGIVLDFAAQPALSVTVSVDDASLGTGVDDSVSYVLLVTDSNDPPVVWLANIIGSVDEMQATDLPIKVADIVVTDDAIGNNQLQLSGSDAANFQIVGSELYLAAGVQLNHETQTSFSVVIEVDDTLIGLSEEDSVPYFLTITDVAEAPVLDLVDTGNLLFLENAPPLAIAPALLVSEPDANTLLSATVSIVAGYDASSDTLGFTPQGGVNGSFDAVTGVLHLSGSATAQDYQAVLRSVQFSNLSDDPLESVRIVEYQVSDGQLDSVPTARFVDVVAVNDEQQVTTAAIVVQPDEPLVLDATLLNATDPDNTDTELVFTLPNQASDTRLLVNGQIAQSFTQQDLLSGVVMIVHNGQVAGNQTLVFLVDDGQGSVTQAQLFLSIDVPTAEVVEAPPLGPALAAETAETAEVILPAQLPDLVAPSAQVDAVDIIGSANEMLPAPVSQLQAESAESAIEAVDSDGSNTAAIGSTNTDLQQTVLMLPDVPAPLRVSEIAQLVAEVSGRPVVSSEQDSHDEIVDDQLASLLSLAPIELDTDALAQLEWQVENGGFDRSLEKMHESFKQSAQNEAGDIVANTVVGISLSVTAGFLIWVLRGGTLLASMFSIAPLWKQLDPLPIVGASNAASGSSVDGKPDKVEKIFEGEE